MIFKSPKRNQIHTDITQKFKEINRKISYPNAGGCACIALKAYEYAIAVYPNAKADIIYMYGKSYYWYADEVINGNAVSCNHAVLKVGTRYYDCNGCYTKKELVSNHRYSDYLIPVSKELVKKSLRKNLWNKRFDRKSEMPKVRRIFAVPKGDSHA